MTGGPCVDCGGTETADRFRRDRCSRCYHRLRRIERGLPIVKTWQERFAERYTVNESSGCWEWTGATRYGYARLSINGRRRLVHRVSYEMHVGPIPDGLVLDHLCRNRRCINPEHLEPVTNAENLRRGMAPKVVLWRANRCARGHDMSKTGYVRPDNGKRFCRQCASDRARAHRLGRAS